MAPDDRGVAVAGQRDGPTLSRKSIRVAADQLSALLSPGVSAAGKDPRRPDTIIVVGAAENGGGALAGQCDGSALLGKSDRAGSDQLPAC